MEIQIQEQIKIQIQAHIQIQIQIQRQIQIQIQLQIQIQIQRLIYLRHATANGRFPVNLCDFSFVACSDSPNTTLSQTATSNTRERIKNLITSKLIENSLDQAAKVFLILHHCTI